MAKPQQRSYTRRPLSRRTGVRDPKRTFLVFCEGAKTEPAYLGALRRDPDVRDKAAVEIQINEKSFGWAPLTLVEAAVEARVRSIDENGEIDEVWCIFDVEWPQNHPNLQKAVALAKDNNVAVAVSNPCFELWLVLHFEDQSRFLNTKEAIRRRRECDSNPGKGLEGPAYMKRRTDAARRARILAKRHESNRTPFPKDNPSSGMYLLLDAIEGTPVESSPQDRDS